MHGHDLRRQAFALLVLTVIHAPSFGEFPPVLNSQNPDEQPPTPLEAASKITVPEGFHVTLFAGEPDVAQPISFDLDDRGRLWVVECYTYDGGGYNDQFRDRILILTDEDNNGSFDSRRVFWEQGQRVTGVTHGFGGVWVLANGQLLVLPDKDRDDTLDGPPSVMLDGFDVERSAHNVVNGLLWGPDGWLYGRHGILATSSVGSPGTPDYERTKLNCSIWRFHPTLHRFEVVMHGTTNPWGLDYNDWGEFFATNNVIGHLWHIVPGAHFKRMYGEDFNPHAYDLIDQCADHYHWDTGQNWADSRDARGVHGQLGGGHSHCGGMIYLGDNWPDEYRNAIFMCNTHGRRVNVNSLERQGNGYTGRRAPDFLFANQPWFRGVELKYGPDGGVYLTDWTDLGECHDRDGVHRTSGRIYKIIHGEPQGKLPKDLGALNDDELVELQLHRNDWLVRRARRVLQERATAGENLEQAHRRLVEIFDQHPDATRKLRAMWALYAIDGADTPWLANQLHHRHEAVRAWAIRLLTDLRTTPDAVLPRFRQMAVGDPSGLVRLYLAASLQRLPKDRRWPIAIALAGHAEDKDDPAQTLMIWYGIEPAVCEHPDQALQLISRTLIPQLRTFTARRLTSEIEKSPKPVGRLLELAAARPSRNFRLDVLRGMTDALRGWRKATPPIAWPRVQAVLAQGDSTVQAASRELALVFGDGRALQELKSIALDGSQPPEMRRQALETLVANRPAEFAPTLLRLAKDRVTNVTAIRGLAAYEHPETAQTVLSQFHQLDTIGRRECVNTLASRPQFALQMLRAVEQGEVAANEISAYHARQMASFQDTRVDRLLAEHWGVIRQTPADRAKLIVQLKSQLTDSRLAAADRSRGRAIFKKSCATCHRLFGDGETIGPDLTGSNRDNLEYLLDNIVDPSAVVAQDYRISNLALVDGRVISGTILGTTERTLRVQTQERLLVLDRDDVEEIAASSLSLMADGLLKSLTDAQIADLMSYLQNKTQVALPGE